jgi:hypothetical protein
MGKSSPLAQTAADPAVHLILGTEVYVGSVERLIVTGLFLVTVAMFALAAIGMAPSAGRGIVLTSHYLRMRRFRSKTAAHAGHWSA